MLATSDLAPRSSKTRHRHKRYDVREALAVVTDPSHSEIKAHLSAISYSLRRAAVIASWSFFHLHRHCRVVIFVVIVIMSLSADSIGCYRNYHRNCHRN